MIAKIKVLSLDHDRVIGSKRLICSPGLYRASNCEVEQGFYASDTLLPKDLWTEASSEILTSKPSLFKPTEHIGFFGIKKSQLAKLSDLHAKYEKTRLQVKFQQAVVKSFVDEIGNSLFERFPFEGQPTSLGLGFNSSGLTTVTVDYKAGCKTGLHYDSWFVTGNSPAL
jgi:hypothetical protein